VVVSGVKKKVDRASGTEGQAKWDGGVVMRIQDNLRRKQRPKEALQRPMGDGGWGMGVVRYREDFALIAI
jgi:hypothetical protein